jgi:hypothetical protein
MPIVVELSIARLVYGSAESQEDRDTSRTEGLLSSMAMIQDEQRHGSKSALQS